MNDDYLDGLEHDLRKTCLQIAKELEVQAIEALECEPDAERVVSMAETLEQHMNK